MIAEPSDFFTLWLWVGVSTLAVVYAMLQHMLRVIAWKRMKTMAEMTKAIEDSHKTLSNGHKPQGDPLAEEFVESLRRPYQPADTDPMNHVS